MSSVQTTRWPNGKPPSKPLPGLFLVPNEVYRLVIGNSQVTEIPIVDRSVLETKAVSNFLYCSSERQTIVQDTIHKCTLCGDTACNSGLEITHVHPKTPEIYAVCLSEMKLRGLESSLTTDDLIDTSENVI
ncbi:hypothetical protein N7463_002165 [Penicillium fimorum]|uniref:Uncharacterized protein n=1 Tax=Penicillium fimorum TaxID=1882269 RepID=A0A9X0C832_9EURO|nr:hypothetical protein N7463_002165 [Penicillium fimorum]